MMQRNGAAVDLELSCLLLEDYERAVPFPNPSFNGYGFTQFDNNRVFIMAITRLDGPGPEVVRNMIDGALEAENSMGCEGALTSISSVFITLETYGWRI